MILNPLQKNRATVDQMLTTGYIYILWKHLFFTHFLYFNDLFHILQFPRVVVVNKTKWLNNNHRSCHNHNRHFPHWNVKIGKFKDNHVIVKKSQYGLIFKMLLKNHETFLSFNKLLTQFPRIKSSKSVLEHFGDSKLLAFKFFLFPLWSIVAIWFLKNESWLWNKIFKRKLRNQLLKMDISSMSKWKSQI